MLKNYSLIYIVNRIY